MEIALTYIHGIGKTSARKILDEVEMAYTMNSDDLNDNDVVAIRKIIDASFTVEGDRRREVIVTVRASPAGDSGPAPMPGPVKVRSG
jgi:small subunit ribosomal protein S13